MKFKVVLGIRRKVKRKGKEVVRVTKREEQEFDVRDEEHAKLEAERRAKRLEKEVIELKPL